MLRAMLFIFGKGYLSPRTSLPSVYPILRIIFVTSALLFWTCRRYYGFLRNLLLCSGISWVGKPPDVLDVHSPSSVRVDQGEGIAMQIRRLVKDEAHAL